jgi:hypothetical protein
MFWTIVGAILFVILLPFILVALGYTLVWGFYALLLALPLIATLILVETTGNDAWGWLLALYPVAIVWVSIRQRRSAPRPTTNSEPFLLYGELQHKEEKELDEIAYEIGVGELEPVARRRLALDEKKRRDLKSRKLANLAKAQVEMQDFRPRIETLLTQIGLEWTAQEKFEERPGSPDGAMTPSLTGVDYESGQFFMRLRHSESRIEISGRVGSPIHEGTARLGDETAKDRLIEIVAVDAKAERDEQSRIAERANDDL